MPLLALILFIIVVVIVVFILLFVLRAFYSVDKFLKGLGEKKRDRKAIRLAEIELQQQESRQKHEKTIASMEALGFDAEKLGLTESDHLEH